VKWWQQRRLLRQEEQRLQLRVAAADQRASALLLPLLLADRAVLRLAAPAPELPLAVRRSPPATAPSTSGSGSGRRLKIPRGTTATRQMGWRQQRLAIAGTMI
jgi:hypothetical protein